MEDKKLKCLTINEYKEISKFGSKDSSATNTVLTFYLKDSSMMHKFIEYRYLPEFILHYYVSDTMEPEIAVGVNRYEKCKIVEYNESKNLIKILSSNKKFFNMSELKLLRKDKIGNMLLNYGDEEINKEDQNT